MTKVKVGVAGYGIIGQRLADGVSNKVIWNSLGSLI